MESAEERIYVLLRVFVFFLFLCLGGGMGSSSGFGGRAFFFVVLCSCNDQWLGSGNEKIQKRSP